MKNEIATLLDQIHKAPETISFEQVMRVIDKYYQYTPVAFCNGMDDGSNRCLVNEPGVNEGSCKIFSFAKLHNLDKNKTLHCFGQYYRNDVLKYPDSNNHTNIRNFMKFGWSFIKFEEVALNEK